MSLYSQLFDFQKRIVDKFRERDAFGLFLDMGLGKTITSLAFAEQHSCTKIIVVTINAKAEESENLKDSWLGWSKQYAIPLNRCQKWTKEFNQQSNDIFVVNYESLFSRKKDVTGLILKDNIYSFIDSCKGHNVALIIDESHKMKNLQSKQSKALFQIQKRLMITSNHLYTYLLTGTPFTTGYIDLYTQLKMLGYQETKTAFIDRYCVRANIPGLLGWQQPIAGYKNITELYRTIHRYAITVKSEEVINLPEQVFVQHPQPCSNAFILFTYEKIKQKQLDLELARRNGVDTCQIEAMVDGKYVNNPFFRNIAYPELKWIADTTGVFWMRARQLSIGFQGNASEATWFDTRRLQSIRQFLEEYEDNYIIFYNYTPELLELFEICDDLGYNVDVYCGEVKSLNFYEKYSNLSEEQKLTSKKNVIIANFASGSTGMNWQQYNKAIIASTPLYKDYAQAIKRIHRPGQKETTFYHLFYQENWLDKGMNNALLQQQDYNEKMFEDDLVRVRSLLETQNNQ